MSCALLESLCTSISLYCGMLMRVESELDNYLPSVMASIDSVEMNPLSNEYYKKMLMFESRCDVYALQMLLTKLKRVFSDKLVYLNSIKDNINVDNRLLMSNN
jgi:hypothetical protein